MPSTKPKYWIPTTETSYRHDGFLQVGQILRTARDPLTSLILPHPLPLPDDLQAEPSEEKNVDFESTSDLQLAFNTWASAAGLPVGGDVGVKTSNSASSSWHFDKLSAHVFPATPAYRDAALQHPSVLQYTRTFKAWTVSPYVFMVTGVRVAQGQRSKRNDHTSHSNAAHLKVEADLTGVGAPAKVGLGPSVKKSSSEKSSMEGSTDFVFAYRLDKISFRWGKDGKAYPTPVKGDAYSEDAGNAAVSQEEEGEAVIVESIEEYCGEEDSIFED